VIGEANFLDPGEFTKGEITFEVSIGLVGHGEAIPIDTEDEADQKPGSPSFWLSSFLFLLSFF